tara:strand:- start:90 stop:260 length:171 start_codon:yes stop_codon:yes gene_type:complete
MKAKNICMKAKKMFQVKAKTKRGYWGENASKFKHPKIRRVCEIMYGLIVIPVFKNW